MMRNLRNALRLLKIAATLARHDALFIFSDMGFTAPGVWLAPLRRRSRLSKGERLARAFEALGPTFIKLGQALSTRSDLVGEEIAEALADLRDNLPPFDASIARATIEDQLGQPLDVLFEHFDGQAVAAASIAQVHKATLKDGRLVAVKILRPGIGEAFARDIELFYWVAETIEKRLPQLRRLKPIEIVDTFRQTVAFELDLRYEAAGATEMAANIQGDSGFRVPAIDWHLTAETVMVMDWVEGTPLADVEALQARGVDLNALLARLSENFFKHVFRDGFFHADMHPGNLFVDESGDIVAVDFGIMGRLDMASRLYVAEILRGFLREDYRHVAETHIRAGYVPRDTSADNFALACMAIAKPILDRPLNEISVGRLLGQLFRVTETFQMETQPQLLLLQKTLVVVEGVGRMLNPQVNMWEMAREPIEAWVREQFSAPGRLKHAARHGAEVMKTLPLMLERAERALTLLADPRGLKLHPDSLIHVALHSRRLRRGWLIFAWTALAAMVIMWGYTTL